MKALIQSLVEVPAPSGYETQIRTLIRGQIDSLADEVWADNLGSLIASKGSGGARVMLAAHMDEVGLIATHVDENGFVRFLPVGTVYPMNCPGSRVRFLNGARGVIGIERQDGDSKLPGFERMFLDLGVSSRDECPVRVGDMAVFEGEFVDLGGRIVSKAMDNRVSVAVQIETLRRLSALEGQIPNQVYFVFSVQEEVGVRGAAPAAFSLEPDLGLSVDVTPCGDTPKGLKKEVALGKGPVLKVRDQGMISDPRLVQWMAAAAERAGLPYQLEAHDLGSTDARAIQRVRSGVPAGSLSIPCRYVHSASEMVDTVDLENAVRLLVELLSHPVELDFSA